MDKDSFSEDSDFAALMRAAAHVPTPFPPAPALDVGTILRDRFVIEGRLGAGGMGVVYRAHDRHAGGQVALKTLRHIDSTGLVDFKREFRNLADVAHRNLVLLHELVRDDDLWFFTMELVDGAPLGPKDPVRASFAQLVDGVQAIHASGRIHRDLKPSNVLVERTGRVVILDFGLAAEVDLAAVAPESLGAAGTPAYMAPEQTLGGAAGLATDWFAVGVMLFQRLTGRLPWDGPAHSLLVRRRIERAPRPSTLCDVPRELDALCWRMLALDPAERPTGAEIRACVADASGGTLHSISVAPPHPDLFVGREDELRMLHGLFGEAPSRRCIVQIVGPPGIGKSTLLRRALGALDAERHLVISNRCHTRESVPFAALDAVVDRFAREWRESVREALRPDEAAALCRLFPVLNASDAYPTPASLRDPDEALAVRLAAAQGLRSLLHATSRGRMLVLWIDDFQWADADSARLLGEILAAPEAPPMLLVLTMREALDPRRLEDVTAGGRIAIASLDLGPLSSAAAREMARTLLEPAASGRADAIALEASGHPFFVEILARWHDSSSEAQPLAPNTLDAAIGRRVEILEGDLRRILTAVAVAGQPIPQAVAARAAQTSGDASAVRELCARGFLRLTRGHVIEPYHDRIRDVIYDQLGPSGRAGWHGAVGTALEGHGGAAPEALAQHYSLAGMVAQALPHAVEGAERALRALAFDRAAEFLAMARQGAMGDPALESHLANRHAEALLSARRCREAAEAFLRIAAAADHDELRARAERRAVTAFFVGGHVRAGLDVLAPMLHRAGVDVPANGEALRGLIMMETIGLLQRGFDVRTPTAPPDPAVLARIDLLRTAADAWSSLDPPRATVFLLRAAPLALDCGDSERAAWALCHLGLLFASLAEATMQARGAALLEVAAAMVDRLDVPSMHGLVELARARAALSVGRFREGVRCGELCLRRAERTGVGPAVVQVAQTVRLYGLLACGQLPRLREMLPGLRADAQRREDAYWLVTVRLYAAHLRLVCEGDAEGALDQVDVAMREWGESRMLFQTWVGVRTRVLGALYARRDDEARACLDDAWPKLEESGLLSLGVVRPDALRLRGLVALRGEPRVTLVEGIATSLSDSRPDEAAARLALCAGLVAAEGRRDEAAAMLRRVCALHRLAGQRLDALVADAASRALAGASPDRSLARMRQAGVHDPARWLATMAPFAATSGPGATA